MTSLHREQPPESLAELHAAPGHECPIPHTHDKVAECHYWWHELARTYHEPDRFRYTLGAFLQAARSVTFMLQSEKHAFNDFSWYQDWVDEAKRDNLLSWLNEARVEVVHQRALAPRSEAVLTCIRAATPSGGVMSREVDDDEDKPITRDLNPFLCTHVVVSQLSSGPVEDHDHELVRSWYLDSLPGRELLVACVEVYEKLSAINEAAHGQLRNRIVSNYGGVRSPCMTDTTGPRTAHLNERDGRVVWVNQPKGLENYA